MVGVVASEFRIESGPLYTSGMTHWVVRKLHARCGYQGRTLCIADCGSAPCMHVVGSWKGTRSRTCMHGVLESPARFFPSSKFRLKK